jgi:hypothetical protein
MSLKSILTIIYGILFLGSFVPVLFSAMMFDAPDSHKNPQLWRLAYGIWSLPVTIALSVVFTWTLRNFGHSNWWFALPLVSIVWIVLAKLTQD